MRFRPGLVIDYQSDAAVFRSNVQRFWFGILLLVAVLLGLGATVPLVPGLLSLSLEAEMLVLAVGALFAAIAALGLNIVTGFAGQVSLGHAFFVGIGAYTAAILGGVPETRSVFDLNTGAFVEQTLLWGYELDMIIWLPAAGLVAAGIGYVVAPLAVKLRGLYLAFVTLGLVYLGEHVFSEAALVSGGRGNGRPVQPVKLFGFRFDEPGEVLGVHLEANQKLFFLGLALVIVFGLVAKNLARSRIGRALAAIRDRDIAASMMGIDLARYKRTAFVVSSFYAGVAGAMLYSAIGFFEPREFGLFMSIEFLAMVLIGGVATVSGSIIGAFFLVFLPRLVRGMATLPIFGFISDTPSGGLVDLSQAQHLLFGGLIVGFLIFEPLGIYGIWIRVRNYWKAWPFSY
jgi:branched-chain amino acid transport system permease protein